MPVLHIGSLKFYVLRCRYFFNHFLSLAVSVEAAYLSNNSYHNSTHAADVTQAMHCYLSEPQVRNNIIAWRQSIRNNTFVNCNFDCNNVTWWRQSIGNAFRPCFLCKQTTFHEYLIRGVRTYYATLASWICKSRPHSADMQLQYLIELEFVDEQQQKVLIRLIKQIQANLETK